MMEWLQQNAAAIQASSALAIVILTGVLVWVTHRYASITDRQYREMVASRLASLAPYVHVKSVHQGRGAPDPDKPGAVITPSMDVVVRVANMLPGPALRISGEIVGSGTEPGAEPYYWMTYSVDLVGNGAEQELGFSHNQPPQAERFVDRPESHPAMLFLTYSDVLHRWWRTTVPIRLFLARYGESAYTYCVGEAQLLEPEERSELTPAEIQERAARAGRRFRVLSGP